MDDFYIHAADSARALFHAVDAGLFRLPEQGKLLFAYGATGPWLSLLPPERAIIFQPHRSQAQSLEALGYRVFPTADDLGKGLGGIGAVLVLVPKQHDEARYILAQAAAVLPPAGLLVAVAPNDAGGRRLPEDVGQIAIVDGEYSKHKCRVVWGRTNPVASDTAATWLKRGEMQKLEGGQFWSQPGLFSWDRIDLGSALLAQNIPDNLAGRGADFGCGWGYLSAVLLQKKAAISELCCIDEDMRALESCRRNTGKNAEEKIFYLWHDLSAPPPAPWRDLDFIIMNPPFHAGSKTLPALGRAFIRSAFATLRPGGRLFMVANVRLAYENELSTLFKDQRKLCEQNGFKLIEAIR